MIFYKAGKNIFDQQRVVGKPQRRVDGPLKVTGTATYAYEQQPTQKLVYGYIVGAEIASGQITGIDERKAKHSEGVIDIITYQNVPEVGTGAFLSAKALGGPHIQHYHQAVAIVVASSFEQARAAASSLVIHYKREAGQYSLQSRAASAPLSKSGSFRPDPVSSVGNFVSAFQQAAVKVDEVYTTPDQSHAMMEPHATVAYWEKDMLHCWTGVQQLNWGVRDLAFALGVPKEKIRMRAPFIGGSFGVKGTVMSDTVLAALAARKTGLAVKVTLQRPLVANNTAHRPATIQHVQLGANRDGKLTAIGHRSVSGNIPGGRPEAAVLSTRYLYHADNRATELKLAELNLPEGSAMRAPGEAPGQMALEIAMDELAEKLKIDPVELRIINDTRFSPEHPNKTFSQRNLARCLERGAEAFGWHHRSPTPGQQKAGRWLKGMGVSSAIRGAPVLPSAARLTLQSDGRLNVKTDMTDIGTGTYTILAQTAADMFGLTPADIDVQLGDSAFPESPGSGGQWGAASSTAGVYAACVALQEKLAEKVGASLHDLSFSDGLLIVNGTSVSLQNLASQGEISADAKMEYSEGRKEFEHQTFGAHFVEVEVNEITFEVRVKRMLAVCDAGRIINPKAAENQVLGGMVMGLGAALMEELVVDERLGFFVNHDLAGYEIPVHADIPQQSVIFIDDVDEFAGPLKAKGVGELGLTGVAPAIANAIYNATGIRVRDYPLTLDKLMTKARAI
ncbi:xanthine dehydrogenase family protein molybdopterin-binding subunit [Halioxenophilus aromaticivorans]|uniref:Xanthine dehydrogenase family protein molybdopterin-binding subunit n=1 Tax=Halioxenophilus aromaticivorans TaxID=1306992 RepID=A0AAV3U3W9_9ALTE